MKREVAIVLGVLVPFAVLVALGLLWPRSDSAVAPQAASIPVAAARPPAPEPVARQPGADAPVAAPAQPPAPTPDAGAQAPLPPTLEAPIRAVTPEVRLCWEDLNNRPRGPLSLEVTFRPLPDGGFADVVVTNQSWPDPWLGLCVEDVFQQVGYLPTGREDFARATHRFVFDPSQRQD